MKLKRIISALVVFTLVMTCAVCSVSAAGTYNVTTSYDVSTKSITVDAAIAGATEGSMVSYLIVAPVTTGEGEEATTSYDVQPDGSNIKHIDQATVNASGTATMDTVTTAFADLDGTKVKFTSTDDDLDALETARKADGSVSNVWSYTKSVTTFNKLQKGILFANASDSGKSTPIYYVTSDGKVGGGSRGQNLTAARWDQAKMGELLDGDLTNLGKDFVKYFPIDDVVAYVVDLGNNDARDTYVKLVIKKAGTSFNGDLNTTGTVTLYDNLSGEDTVNLMVNGLYKEDVTDLKFGSNDEITLEGGAVLYVDKTNVPFNNASAKGTEAVKAMSIDAQPIYGEYTTSVDTYDSVTFLVTATDTDIADAAGLKITAYPKGTTTKDAVLPEEGEPVELGICPNAYAGQTKFAIQLYDTAREGYLDPDKFDLVATPVINDGTVEEPNWVELTTVGTITDGRYFTINRDTVANEYTGE